MGKWRLLSSESRLCFQISQCFLSKDNIPPIYHIWRPRYLGISIPWPDSKLCKLNSNDLIVTKYKDDTAPLKAKCIIRRCFGILPTGGNRSSERFRRTYQLLWIRTRASAGSTWSPGKNTGTLLFWWLPLLL